MRRVVSRLRKDAGMSRSIVWDDPSCTTPHAMRTMDVRAMDPPHDRASLTERAMDVGGIIDDPTDVTAHHIDSTVAA